MRFIINIFLGTVWWYLKLAPECLIPDRDEKDLFKVISNHSDRTKAAKQVIYWWHRDVIIFNEFFGKHKPLLKLKSGWYRVAKDNKSLVPNDPMLDSIPIIGKTLDFEEYEDFDISDSSEETSDEYEESDELIESSE